MSLPEDAFALQVGGGVRRYEESLPNDAIADLYQLVLAGKWALANAAGLVPS